MYAVCVACNASSAEMGVTFASSYSHPHFPPVVLVLIAEVPFPPAEPETAVVVVVVVAVVVAGDVPEADPGVDLPADAKEAECGVMSRSGCCSVMTYHCHQ